MLLGSSIQPGQVQDLGVSEFATEAMVLFRVFLSSAWESEPGTAPVVFADPPLAWARERVGRFGCGFSSLFAHCFLLSLC